VKTTEVGALFVAAFLFCAACWKGLHQDDYASATFLMSIAIFALLLGDRLSKGLSE
jgi:uncharacterized membrane protein